MSARWGVSQAGTHRRSTYRPAPVRTRLVWRRDAVASAVAALGVAAVVAAGGVWAVDMVTEDHRRTPGVPACTHAIADAGGVCIGEPR